MKRHDRVLIDKWSIPLHHPRNGDREKAIATQQGCDAIGQQDQCNCGNWI